MNNKVVATLIPNTHILDGQKDQSKGCTWEIETGEKDQSIFKYKAGMSDVKLSQFLGELNIDRVEFC